MRLQVPWEWAEWLVGLDIYAGSWVYMDIETPFGAIRLVVPPWDIPIGTWLLDTLYSIAWWVNQPLALIDGWLTDLDGWLTNLNEQVTDNAAYLFGDFTTWIEGIRSELQAAIDGGFVSVGEWLWSLQTGVNELWTAVNDNVNQWLQSLNDQLNELGEHTYHVIGPILTDWQPHIEEAKAFANDPWDYLHGRVIVPIVDNIHEWNGPLVDALDWLGAVRGELTELTSNPTRWVLNKAHDALSRSPLEVKGMAVGLLVALWRGGAEDLPEGDYDPVELAELRAAIQRYFPPEQWRNAELIATCETPSLNRNAWNRDGEDSRGIFQINVGPGANPQYANLDLFDLDTNVRIAAEVYRSWGNWGPWFTCAQRFGLL